MRRVAILGAVLVSAFLAPSGASARPPSPCDYWVHGCDVYAYVCDATTHLLGFCLEPNAAVPAAKV